MTSRHGFYRMCQPTQPQTPNPNSPMNELQFQTVSWSLFSLFSRPQLLLNFLFEKFCRIFVDSSFVRYLLLSLDIRVEVKVREIGVTSLAVTVQVRCKNCQVVVRNIAGDYEKIDC